jgi:uncharacterized membrane protein
MVSKSNRLAVQKSISWHIVHILLLIATSFLVTGRLDIVAAFISIHVVSETIMYYLHEKAWQKIKKYK